MKENQTVKRLEQPHLLLRKIVRDHSVFKHPYLEAAKENRLKLEDVRLFAVQELFISMAFPAMMAEIVCKVPYHLENQRYPLIVNMGETQNSDKIVR